MKIRCKKCNTIIEGDKRGTLIWCDCHSCFIDETKHYVRIGGEPTDIEEIEGNKENFMTELFAMNYNVIEYGEIINGELTYKTIAEKLKSKGSLLIGWCDEEYSHYDILFLYQTDFAGTNIQGGIRQTDLFISIMRKGAFGFEINNQQKSPEYIAEKLHISGTHTSKKIAELINGVIKEMREE